MLDGWYAATYTIPNAAVDIADVIAAAAIATAAATAAVFMLHLQVFCIHTEPNFSLPW